MEIDMRGCGYGTGTGTADV